MSFGEEDAREFEEQARVDIFSRQTVVQINVRPPH